VPSRSLVPERRGGRSLVRLQVYQIGRVKVPVEVGFELCNRR
jgi:hypothetical protein